MRTQIIDPLVEQMNSVLHLYGPTNPGPPRVRTRRFSDADTVTNAESLTKPDPISVRSKDGSRWLPAPDEQTRTIASTKLKGRSADAPVTSQPLAKHNCSADSCAALKVFGTTELLELILSFLDTRSLVNLRGSSRMWESTIKDSPQLRLHLYYYPQFMRPASTFQLLPLSLPGLMIYLGEPLYLGRWIFVGMTRGAARKIAPDYPPRQRVRSRSIFEGLRGGLGSRSGPSSDPWPAAKSTSTLESSLEFSELLITQPPIVGMQAFMLMNARWDEPRTADDEIYAKNVPATAKLACDAGITLGFLAETVQSLLASSPNKVDDETKVIFKAIVSFTRNEAAPRQRSSARSITRIGPVG